MEKVKASVCYCRIPFRKLAELVRLRFVEGFQTEELMKRMKSEREREYLATVALLDVSEKDLIHMIEAEKPDELRHFLDCRAHALEILKSNGLEVKER
ncbi:MAG: hypothetical protein A3G87_00175 [Omnitrophica bacterium RIFCSPLOWO2_12_FULL_50_11]|nr:MAG: hypothetical protein A3G87_00175 [Omnitrophica bacterium RIFCSPLOWO2_12_FULL_50_11]